MNALCQTVDQALVRLLESTDELRDLDAAIGDGDLGVTVSKGVAAMRSALASLGDATPASQVLFALGSAFAGANPSTMGALVGGALLESARVAQDGGSFGLATALAVMRAGAESIAKRGKSAVGDKTILDAIVPAADALEKSEGARTSEVLTAMIVAAKEGVELTRPLLSKRGRAAWTGERSAGQPDPGAVAFLRFLEALRTTWDAP